MTEQTYDYDGVADSQPKPSDKLAQLNKLAVDHREAEMAVIKAEDALKVAQKKLRDYEENLIPSIMSELELKTFTTKDGMTVEIENRVRASIPEELRPRAFIWLRENGHAALIKHELKVDFSMGEDELASEWLKKLQDAGLEPDEKESVHSSTLVSFVKECLIKGINLPDEINVFQQNVAKVALPKVKKR